MVRLGLQVSNWIVSSETRCSIIKWSFWMQDHQCRPFHIDSWGQNHCRRGVQGHLNAKSLPHLVSQCLLKAWSLKVVHLARIHQCKITGGCFVRTNSECTIIKVSRFEQILPSWCKLLRLTWINKCANPTVPHLTIPGFLNATSLTCHVCRWLMNARPF